MIGVAALFFFGPLGLQAFLWSSFVEIQCTKENARLPPDVACHVTSHAWIGGEARDVRVERAVRVDALGQTEQRGDMWLVLTDDRDAKELTPKLNVAKGGQLDAMRALNVWLGDEAARGELHASFGSPWGAIYVPMISSVLCVLVWMLVTSTVRATLAGGRVTFRSSKSLVPKTARVLEVALDDVRCLSFDGPKLVVVTKQGEHVLAASTVAQRAEKLVLDGNAWIEEAKRARERA